MANAHLREKYRRISSMDVSIKISQMDRRWSFIFIFAILFCYVSVNVSVQCAWSLLYLCVILYLLYNPLSRREIIIRTFDGKWTKLYRFSYDWGIRDVKYRYHYQMLEESKVQTRDDTVSILELARLVYCGAWLFQQNGNRDSDATRISDTIVTRAILYEMYNRQQSRIINYRWLQ
jgi:hypothetical protein